MKARVTVFVMDGDGEFLYNVKIEVNSVEDVLQMVAAGIYSANADVNTDDIISDIDKGIIRKTIEQKTDFCKTVKITKEVKLYVSIDED